MERRNEVLLQHGLEIDEHVAAADHVEARKRRVDEHVVFGEDAQVADRLRYPILAVQLVEVAA